jgi:hypothetical protein
MPKGGPARSKEPPFIAALSFEFQHWRANS